MQQHFSVIISKNINDTRTLFAMVDKLTNTLPPPTHQSDSARIPHSRHATNLLALLMKKIQFIR